MAQRKSNLKNIGAEGFAMMDEYQYVHNHNHKYQQLKSHVNQVIIPVKVATQAKKEVVSIDSYQAAKMYGGILIAEYPKNRKPLMGFPKFYN